MQELRLPGDEVIAQLGLSCPRLRVLALPDAATHGPGLARPRWAPPGVGHRWLKSLRELELCGSMLLRSSVRDLAACYCMACAAGGCLHVRGRMLLRSSVGLLGSTSLLCSCSACPATRRRKPAQGCTTVSNNTHSARPPFGTLTHSCCTCLN